MLDTRINQGGGAVGPSGTLKLAVAGTGLTVPASATSVVLNVTATQPTASGYITVWGDQTARPVASSLNFAAGETVPNLVVAPVGAGGAIDFFNGSTGTTQLIADIAGYYIGGGSTQPGTFVSMTPSRLLDTRNGTGGTIVAAGGTVPLHIDGIGAIPRSAVRAVVLNVTVTQPAAGGYITAWPDGNDQPVASNLNFAAGETVPNLVVVPVGLDGKVDLFNGSGGTIQLIADVAGYFLDPPDTTPPGPVTITGIVPGTTSVILDWTNPPDQDYQGVMIRRATGPVAPTSVTTGTFVADVATPGTTYTDTGLSTGTQYSYAFFAHDAVPNYSSAVAGVVTNMRPRCHRAGTGVRGHRDAPDDDGRPDVGQPARPRLRRRDDPAGRRRHRSLVAYRGDARHRHERDGHLVHRHRPESEYPVQLRVLRP